MRSKKGSNDLTATDATPNPDPAVFEAAFVIDDSDDPSRTGTPKPAPPEKDAGGQEPKEEGGGDEDEPMRKSEYKNDEAGEKPAEGSQDEPTKEKQAPEPAASATMAELPPEIKQRLRKLDKLEATYPGRQFLFCPSTLEIGLTYVIL